MKKKKNIRRYKKMIRRSVFLALYIDLRARLAIKRGKMPFEKRYEIAQKFLKIYHKRLKINIIPIGLENIPSDIKGCVFIGNHQGKDDCQVVLHALNQIPTSYIVNDERSHGFILGSVTDFLMAKRVKFDDLKSQIVMYNEMTEEIKNGKRFIVFPEAGYKDNKNTLQDFNTPCFAPVIKSKCPIIPFVLYDSWRVYEDDVLDEIKVWVYFMKPIFEEDYKGQSKKQLAETTKSIIQRKLDEIKESKREEIK